MKYSKTLTDIDAFEWQKQFETRASNAKSWVVETAKMLPLQKRRQVVSHIKEGMEDASFHRDIAYGAKQIRNYLLQDLWHGIKKAAELNLVDKTKRQIDDFSLWTATQAPAHQPAIQELLWDIVPEDIPSEERRARADAMKVACHDTCLFEGL